MKNNEIIKVNENSLLYKLKRIFLNLKDKLFGVKNNQENANSVYENNRNSEKDEFCEKIKIEENQIDNTIFEKEEFIKSLDGNIEALSMLSIERLEKLDEYYQSIIDKNEEVIRRLKMEKN